MGMFVIGCSPAAYAEWNIMVIWLAHLMLHKPDVIADIPCSPDSNRSGAAQGGQPVHQFDALGAHSACL